MTQYHGKATLVRRQDEKGTWGRHRIHSQWWNTEASSLEDAKISIESSFRRFTRVEDELEFVEVTNVEALRRSGTWYAFRSMLESPEEVERFYLDDTFRDMEHGDLFRFSGPGERDEFVEHDVAAGETTRGVKANRLPKGWRADDAVYPPEIDEEEGS